MTRTKGACASGPNPWYGPAGVKLATRAINVYVPSPRFNP